MPGKDVLIFVLLFITPVRNLFAQSRPPGDSVYLSLADAEELFLKKNFLLLAAKYQVSATDASIIQAKLYPNPNFYAEVGAYNPETKKVFDPSSTGELQLELQQMIILGGKRNKQIRMAEISTQISTYQFYDLIRTLRFELRSSFFALYFLNEPLQVYDREIESLKTLIAVYTAQYNKGNVAFKDVARLQALQFSLQNERLELLNQALEKQSTLHLLIGDSVLRPIKPVPDLQLMSRINVNDLNYAQLLDSAVENRYDLKMAREQLRLNETNFSLQKALRVPDLVLGANFDRAGSYIPNYNGLSAAIDLPFWNRNQGNIKSARFQADASRQSQSQAELQVRNDVDKAYKQLFETDKLYKTTSLQFTTDYERLLDGIIKAYQNHTISLLEFIDYYETYKNSKLEFNRLQNNRLDALENLNLATGTIILK